MDTIIRLKRGSDFRHQMVLPETAADYDTIACRARCGVEVWALSVRRLDDAPRVEIHAPAAMTAEWPLRLVACDLRLTVGSEVALTETFQIMVLPEVTTDG